MGKCTTSLHVRLRLVTRPRWRGQDPIGHTGMASEWTVERGREQVPLCFCNIAFPTHGSLSALTAEVARSEIRLSVARPQELGLVSAARNLTLATGAFGS